MCEEHQTDRRDKMRNRLVLAVFMFGFGISFMTAGYVLKNPIAILSSFVAIGFGAYWMVDDAVKLITYPEYYRHEKLKVV